MMAAQSQAPLRGELVFDHPLARYTSWRVGGTAERFYKPADLDDLREFLRGLLPAEPLTWLGLGSNLLIRDGGVRGTVILVHAVLNELAQIGGERVRAQAGVPCAKLARFCAKHDMVEGEFFAGIPGTVGGALAMNAGAFGGDTWQHVVEVETIDRRGRIRTRTSDEYGVAYRTVTAPGEEWYVSATFALPRGDGQASLAKIRQLLARRAETQPTGVASCGSVFRNPPGDYAARLIEACGLKGYAIGGARVSDKHANFIINDGSATAQDMEALIEHIRQRVVDVHAVTLRPEVRMIGEPP
ncbi:MAG: UDP-N-acetylmuramate dehydrogenase [Gammaproteobacteria bacterium]